MEGDARLVCPVLALPRLPLVPRDNRRAHGSAGAFSSV